MSIFAAACVELQKRIVEIGKRPYQLTNNWLEQPARYPSYSDNILQAVWNIAHTLSQSTKERFPKIYLLGEYNALASWFAYFEKDTGIPRIIDDKSYQLGLAFKVFLEVTIAEPQAQEILGSIGIERMSGIKHGLAARLQQYELQQARLALEEFEKRLNHAVDTHPEIPVADVVHITHGTVTYHITLSNLEDQSARIEADKQAYLELIEKLHAYKNQLVEHGRVLAEQHETFAASHPIPSAVTPHKEKLETAREKARHKLLARHKAVVEHHGQIGELIVKAQREHFVLKKKSSSGSQEGKLRDLEERVNQSLTIATESHEKYLEENSAFEAMVSTYQHSLAQLQNLMIEMQRLAVARREFLGIAKKELTDFARMMAATPPTLPLEPVLIIFLEYSDSNKNELVTLYQQAQADIEQQEKRTQKKLLLSPARTELIARVNSKLTCIQAELAMIDITQAPKGEPPASLNEINNNLYSLQKRYQAACHTKVETEREMTTTMEQKKQGLTLCEYNSRQDAMEHQQASLELLLTRLEFLLEDMEYQQQLDASSATQLHADMERVFKELETLRQAFESITTPLPSDVLARKTSLQQEYEALAARVFDANNRFQALQQLSAAKVSAQIQAPIVQQVDEPLAATPPRPQPKPPVIKPSEEPHSSLSALKAAFFGTEQGSIGGAFGAYLIERHYTFWFRDFCGNIAAALLGCLHYQTEQMARTEYLKELQTSVNKYEADPSTFSALDQLINKGLRTFHPRSQFSLGLFFDKSHKPSDDPRSLHSKLLKFKQDLTEVHEPSHQEDRQLTLVS